MPPIGSLHIDVGLTNISIAYQNEMYNGDDVAPIVPVAKRSDKYWQYRKDTFLTSSGQNTAGLPESTMRPSGEAYEINYQVSNTPFYADKYGMRTLVTDDSVAIADSPLQPEVDGALFVAERMLIDNERAVFGVAMNIANFPSTNKEALSTGTTSWAAYGSATSNPFVDIKNGVLAVRLGIQRGANAIAMDTNVALTLADHPLYKDLYKFTHADALTVSGLQPQIRGLRVVESSAVYNSQAPNASGSTTDAYIATASDGTDAALIYYSQASPQLRGRWFMLTFEAPNETTGTRGIITKKWREERRSGVMVQSEMLRCWQIISVDSNGLALGGYLISSAIV